MKCKVILRYGLSGAKKPPLGSAIIAHLEQLGLRKTPAESWESPTPVSLSEAMNKLGELMKLLANPSQVPQARGRLKHFWLYVEVQKP